VRLLVVPEDVAERVKRTEPGVIEVPVDAQMEDLVARLMPGAVPRVPGADWTEQARRNAHLRTGFLAKFPVLRATEPADLSEPESRGRRAAASHWASARRIFGVDLSGQVLYPEFQFDEAGQPRAAVAEALEALRPLRLSDWALALWWGTGSEALGWRAPAEVLAEEPEGVVAAARLDASSLGR
jgi:hypothetical protein